MRSSNNDPAFAAINGTAGLSVDHRTGNDRGWVVVGRGASAPRVELTPDAIRTLAAVPVADRVAVARAAIVMVTAAIAEHGTSHPLNIDTGRRNGETAIWGHHVRAASTDSPALLSADADRATRGAMGVRRPSRGA